MKIYKDQTCLNESTKLDLGIVLAGGSKLFEFYVKNDSAAYLENLKFSLDESEVKITLAPERLDPQEVSKLIFEWKPSVTLKKGLNTTIHVTGEELWRG